MSYRRPTAKRQRERHSSPILPETSEVSGRLLCPSARPCLQRASGSTFGKAACPQLWKRLMGESWAQAASALPPVASPPEPGAWAAETAGCTPTAVLTSSLQVANTLVSGVDAPGVRKGIGAQGHCGQCARLGISRRRFRGENSKAGAVGVWSAQSTNTPFDGHEPVREAGGSGFRGPFRSRTS